MECLYRSWWALVGKKCTVQISCVLVIVSECSLLSPEFLVLPTVILFHSSPASETLSFYPCTFSDSPFFYFTYKLPQLHATTTSDNQPVSKSILSFVSMKEVFLCMCKNRFSYSLDPSHSHFFRDHTLFIFLPSSVSPFVSSIPTNFKCAQDTSLLMKLSSRPFLPASFHRLILWWKKSPNDFLYFFPLPVNKCISVMELTLTKVVSKLLVAKSRWTLLSIFFFHFLIKKFFVAGGVCD